MSKRKDTPKKALLAVTTHSRPWYFALSLAYLAEADTRDYDVWLYIDGEGDPLNRLIAEKTNAKHHVFDRIIQCKENLGCQRLRNKIYHDFKDGAWDFLAYCDDDLVYEPSVFADLLMSLDHLRTSDDKFHFAVGYVNEFMTKGQQIRPERMEAEGRVYAPVRNHGGALWIGTREGFAAIRPEPFSIPPNEGPAFGRFQRTLRRAGLKQGLCVDPIPRTQHVCNSISNISGWKSGWRNAFAKDLEGKNITVPKFCLSCFQLHGEQNGGDGKHFGMFVRAHIKRLGGKVWLPNSEFKSERKKREKHEVAKQMPASPRLDVMPDGSPVGVLISIPSLSGNVNYRLMQRIDEWNARYGKKYKIAVMVHPGIRWEDSARAQQCEFFLTAGEWEWMLSVDDDIVPPGNVLDMIDHGKDVVQAPAVVLVDGMLQYVGMRLTPEDKNVFPDMVFDRVLEELKGYESINIETKQTIGDQEHTFTYPVAMPKPYIEGAFPVDTVGTGCLLVRSCVLENIGSMCHKTRFGPNGNLLCSHDGVWSEWVRDAGFEMWCDTSMRCQHWHGGMDLTEMYDAFARGLYDFKTGHVPPGGKIARLPGPPNVRLTA